MRLWVVVLVVVVALSLQGFAGGQGYDEDDDTADQETDDESTRSKVEAGTHVAKQVKSRSQPSNGRLRTISVGNGNGRQVQNPVQKPGQKQGQRAVHKIMSQPPGLQNLLQSLPKNPVQTQAQQPVQPPAQKPVQPLTQQPVLPFAQKPVEPQAQLSVRPLARNPAKPPAQKPVQPLAQKPVQPQAKQPVLPPAQKPYIPQAQKPVQPLAQKPVKPQALQPVLPPVQKQAPTPVKKIPWGQAKKLGIGGAKMPPDLQKKLGPDFSSQKTDVMSFPDECSLGYTRIEGFGDYKLSCLTSTWAEAESICNSEGGHLAVIESVKERAAMQRVIEQSKRGQSLGDIFVGTKLNTANNVKITVTGERSSIGQCPARSAITDRTGEKCAVVITTTYCLDYVNCDSMLKFMCKIKLADKKNDSPIETPVVINQEPAEEVVKSVTNPVRPEVTVISFPKARVEAQPGPINEDRNRAIDPVSSFSAASVDSGISLPEPSDDPKMDTIFLEPASAIEPDDFYPEQPEE